EGGHCLFSGAGGGWAWLAGARSGIQACSWLLPPTLFLSAFCCASATWGSCRMMGSLGVSLVLFFLFLRLVLGVVTMLPRFLLKAAVKVAEVAEIPIVVVVVALG
ncbi:intestinal mucin-like protein, partial [Arapaima gigas]